MKRKNVAVNLGMLEALNEAGLHFFPWIKDKETMPSQVNKHKTARDCEKPNNNQRTP